MASDQDSYQRALHYTSLACLVACPLIIALPPRRADLFTASLATATLFSANHLHRERYGTGILGRLAGQQRQDLPTDRARAVQAAFAAQRGTQQQVESKTLADKLWYGDEDRTGWREKREAEIRAKMAEGKGIGDVIMDQIWEVWNWGRPSGEED